MLTADVVRPPTYIFEGAARNISREQSTQFTSSLNFFIGRARTVCDAGLALNTHGSLVKGLTPLRAGWAGFFLSFILSAPANLNWPVFFSCVAARATTASATSLTWRCFSPTFSATAE